MKTQSSIKRWTIETLLEQIIALEDEGANSNKSSSQNIGAAIENVTDSRDNGNSTENVAEESSEELLTSVNNTTNVPRDVIENDTKSVGGTESTTTGIVEQISWVPVWDFLLREKSLREP